MKAILLDGFGGPEVLHYGDAPMPEPGPGQVLLRVAATTVNRPDIIQRQGHYPPPPGESDILGLEAAGTVERCGPQVEGFEPGERVTALLPGGGYAQFALAYASELIRIPAALPFNAAACIPETYITAYQNLFINADLQDGQTVLLHGGGGGVNTAAIQECKALTPNSTILVTASSGKLRRVLELGAHHVIDYNAEDFAAATRTLTNGRGADVILDHIGGPYFERNQKALATDGRLALIGTHGGRTAQIDLTRLLVKRQRIIGSVLRPRSRADKAQIIERFTSAVMPHVESGAIEPVIDSVLPLAQAQQAHQRMEASEHFGKIVLEVSHDDAA